MPNHSSECVAIVDFGTGNLFSVRQACEQVGMATKITCSPQEILKASAVILPGVGAFGEAMQSLRALGLVDPLRKVASSGVPLVGICLGMQLLMTESHEFGRYPGLGVIEGEVFRMKEFQTDSHHFKVPQVGWNRIQIKDEKKRNENGSVNQSINTLLEGIEQNAFMYFVHSYFCKPKNSDSILSLTQYGDLEFCSAVRQGNCYGFQFHPEKSGSTGLHIYENLARLIQ